MDISAEIKTLQNKINSNSPITYREAAITIINHEETLLKFLVDNDYQQCYRLLHESDGSPLVVGKTATFEPNKKRVEGEFKLLLAKKDYKTLNDIISKFVLNMDANNYTTSQNIIVPLTDLQALSYVDGKGYMFTGVRYN